MELTTLCYIEKQEQYLMLHRVKKKRDINQDKWIGVGGHVEEGESPEDCLVREVKEETGLELLDYKFRGIVTFVCDEYPTQYMCLYTACGFKGELITCEEGDLEWIDKSKVQSLPIWEGDKLFFSLLEENHPFFSLKLWYEKEVLISAILDGKEILKRNQ